MRQGFELGLAGSIFKDGNHDSSGSSYRFKYSYIILLILKYSIKY